MKRFKWVDAAASKNNIHQLPMRLKRTRGGQKEALMCNKRKSSLRKRIIDAQTPGKTRSAERLAAKMKALVQPVQPKQCFCTDCKMRILYAEYLSELRHWVFNLNAVPALVTQVQEQIKKIGCGTIGYLHCRNRTGLIPIPTTDIQWFIAEIDDVITHVFGPDVVVSITYDIPRPSSALPAPAAASD